MKKLSVVLLILVLVAGSVFAAVTPEFSGRFRFGYKFAFGSEAKAISNWKSPAQLKLKIAFGTDVWQINLKSFGPDGDATGQLDSNDKIGGNLTFNIDKVADMGDHKLAVNMGYNSDMTALTAFNDVTGDEYYKFKNNGKTTFEARYAYADIVNVNLTVDPTEGDTDGDMDSTAKGRSFMISAKGKIVDGVTLAAQYGFRPKMTFYTIARALDVDSDVVGYAISGWNKDFAMKNGFGGSVGIDIAKLADLDFKLKFSAHDNWSKMGDADYSVSVNSFVANVEGGVDAVSGYAEFAVETSTAKAGDEKVKDNYLDLAVGVNVGVVEELPIKVGFKFNDLANHAEGELQSWRVSAEATYKVVGLELAYAKFTQGAGAFVIIPKMVVSF